MSAVETPRLGIIVPTLDEADRLPLLLEDLSRLESPRRVVVADGGSRDGTPGIARASGVEVVHVLPGRGRQMNSAAAALDTPWLLFLHADCRLGPEAREALVRWLRDPPARTAAHFRFALEGEAAFWRFIEFGQRLRERIWKLPYGDQGLLVPRTLFREVGGFPDLPLMEDVEIQRLLRAAGEVRRIEAPLPTSPRRYERNGRWRGWLANTALVALRGVGVPPAVLARCFPSRRPPAVQRFPGERAVAAFVKAPRPGSVKTRIAREVGGEAAARLYRELAGGVVGRLRGGDFRLTLWHHPRDAAFEVRDWLGGTEPLRPQTGEDLGARMAGALERELRDARMACVVGTDAPGLDSARVEDAFSLLRRSDVVLGPARDGGYYLVGLRAPAPGLFEGIPWSTERVLGLTLERARRLGLDIGLLPPLSDVDHLEDVPRSLRPVVARAG